MTETTSPIPMQCTIQYIMHLFQKKNYGVFPCPQTAAFSCHRRQNFERLFSTMYLYTKKHKHHYVIDSLQHHFDYYRSFSYPWNYLFSFSFVKDHFLKRLYVRLPANKRAHLDQGTRFARSLSSFSMVNTFVVGAMLPINECINVVWFFLHLSLLF